MNAAEVSVEEQLTFGDKGRPTVFSLRLLVRSNFIARVAAFGLVLGQRSAGNHQCDALAIGIRQQNYLTIRLKRSPGDKLLDVDLGRLRRQLDASCDCLFIAAAILQDRYRERRIWRLGRSAARCSLRAARRISCSRTAVHHESLPVMMNLPAEAMKFPAGR